MIKITNNLSIDFLNKLKFILDVVELQFYNNLINNMDRKTYSSYNINISLILILK